jgi:hypothetical protein
MPPHLLKMQAKNAEKSYGRAMMMKPLDGRGENRRSPAFRTVPVSRVRSMFLLPK